MKDKDDLGTESEVTAVVTETQDEKESPRKNPRTTGSLAAPDSGHDNVTRMKNINEIEIGRHRIKPWYFSPYPEVSCPPSMDKRYPAHAGRDCYLKLLLRPVESPCLHSASRL